MPLEQLESLDSWTTQERKKIEEGKYLSDRSRTRKSDRSLKKVKLRRSLSWLNLARQRYLTARSTLKPR
jgi:hypothetical protein